MLKCFNSQEYPHDRMEWIIIDDGTDPIEDLVASHPRVKYYKYDTKMTLGKKRNLLHEKSCGEYLVYMDDDDFYPPERVSHAIDMLIAHPEAMCAGSSEIYIYFKHINQMKQFGPYGPNHATAGTFAFRRKLLKQHKYNDDACLAEERAFLKDYTVPFIQLNPMKVILVFSHEHNTFDKRKLLVNANPNVVKDSPKRVNDFIKDAELRKFYMVDLEKHLLDYAPGRPDMKPDVIAQTIQLEKDRAQMEQTAMTQHQQQQHQQPPSQAPDMDGISPILFQQEGQPPVQLTNRQVVEIIQQQQIDAQQRDAKIKQLTDELKQVKEMFTYEVSRSVPVPEPVPVPVPEPVPVPVPVPEPEPVPEPQPNNNLSIPDIMIRYEKLLEENREMRRKLNELQR